jgi:tyrosine-protein kinase Etk/Wzc
MQQSDIQVPSTPSLSEEATTRVSLHDEEISLLDLLVVVGERKSFVLKTVVIVVLLALIVSLMLPSWFTSTVTILPPQQPSSMSAAVLSQLGSFGGASALSGLAGGLNLKNPADTYVALLKSRSVEDAIIERFQLMARYKKRRLSDTREALERHCSIESNAKDGLIRIAIEDRDPRRSAEMANAYLEEFRKFSARLAITEASQRRLFFSQQLEQAKDNLAAAEENLKRTQQSSGMFQLDSQARALIETVAGLRAQIAAKEVQLRGLSTFETSSNPEMVLVSEQLTALQAQLRQLGGSTSGADSDLIVPRGRIPQAGLEYVRKLREVKYNETMFELLAKQLEAAKLDEARQGATIQVVDSAVVPDKRSFPKRTIIIALAGFIALLFSILWVLAHEAIHAIRRRPDEWRKLEALSEAWKHVTLRP